MELLNPAKTDIRRQDFALNFGCDLHLVSISDVVLVDARREKGIGIGAEMMFAAQRGIPIVTWAPTDTHYRRSRVADVFGEDLTDWTHPFVFGLSDHVVEELADAVALIRDLARGVPMPRRIAIERLIERYRTSIGSTVEGAHDRFVHIGGGVYQDLLGGGAETETIAGQPRPRFMDVLYLPTDTAHLPREAMIAVNRWRERRIADRPLLHSSRVRRLIAAIARSMGGPPRVLEIGCGKFPIADDVPCATWTGLEIDGEARGHVAVRGLKALGSAEEVSPEDLDADLAIALFSMQFEIEDAELALLARLPADALIAFNLPTRDKALVEGRLRQVQGLGFATSTLDLHRADVNDLLVLAGRSAAEPRSRAARAAALAAAKAEWPSAAPDLGWTEPMPPIAHRGKVR